MINDYKILLVNRDNTSLNFLEPCIKKYGVSCFSTQHSGHALDLVTDLRPDIFVTDLISGKEGVNVLRKIKKFDPDIFVIILSAFASKNKALSGVKTSAFDLIQKPFSQEQFEHTIENAITQKQLTTKNNGSVPVSKLDVFENIVGHSAVMQEIFTKIEKICKSDANVLIYGESGTGKELFARTIHAHSQRNSEAFIPVDCVALPETLLESELFGYEKGAFTGAESMRRGLLEYADQGILFLDEISELAPNLQAKLLRVLQEQEFRRVGGKVMKRVDLRVISATNQDPLHAVQSGALREDLYYRLNVIPLNLPTLRERKEDIPLFIEHYLEHFGNSSKYRKMRMDDAAITALTNYSWPGNVRELRNLVECLVSLTDGNVITLSDLPEYITAKEARLAPDEHKNGKLHYSYLTGLPFQTAKQEILVDFEREYFTEILKHCDGNISKASRMAEISRRTLYRMIHTHNLEKLI